MQSIKSLLILWVLLLSTGSAYSAALYNFSGVISSISGAPTPQELASYAQQGISAGAKVQFSVYLDDAGVGHTTNPDGSILNYPWEVHSHPGTYCPFGGSCTKDWRGYAEIVSSSVPSSFLKDPAFVQNYYYRDLLYVTNTGMSPSSRYSGTLVANSVTIDNYPWTYAFNEKAYVTNWTVGVTFSLSIDLHSGSANQAAIGSVTLVSRLGELPPHPILGNPRVKTDLALTTAEAPATASQGDTIPYTWTVTNNGPYPATAVSVSGTLPTCTIGDLAVGATAICQASAVATRSGEFGQTMTVISTESDLDPSNNTRSVSTAVAIVNTDLQLSMTATPASVSQGQSVSYMVSVSNNGPSAAVGVTVSGTLPTCDLGTIAVGATANCPILLATATTVGTLAQTMTASGAVTDTGLSNNTVNVSTPVAPSFADLSVSVTAPPTMALGENVNYTVSVTNNGPSPATGVTTSGKLSGVTVIGTLPPCTLGDIAVGATATVTCTTSSVKPTSLGTLTYTTTVSGVVTDSAPANNTASVSTLVNEVTDLSLSLKATPDSVLQGGAVIYTLSITNAGPSPAHSVTVSGTLPASCFYAYIGAGGTVDCTPQTQILTTVGVVTQTMAVSGSGTDPNLGNNGASVSTTVMPGVTYTLSTIMQGNGFGSITGAGVYNAGQTATVSATANSGSLFAGWSGPDAAACTSGSVLMNGDKSCTATFSVIAKPDLTPSALSASKSGSKVSVKDTVRNQGNAPVTSPFSVAYYLSTDTVYQAGTDIALESDQGGICTRNITSLNAGSSSSGNKSCYKPRAASKNVKYYVLVVDDSTSLIVESSEANNTRATSSAMRW